MVINLDIIVIFGDNPDCVWAETVTVIRHLTGAGFILNMKKSESLEKEIKMLRF